MTVTDQPVATDVRCVCGDPKWDHKQGRAACKHCACDTYDPATDPEVAQLRADLAEERAEHQATGRLQMEASERVDELTADLEQLRATRRDDATAAMVAARDLSQQLRRAAAENKRLHASATVLAGQRDEAQRQAKAAQNTAAEMRVQRDAANADRDEARQQAKDAAYAAEQARKGVIQLRQQVADAEAALVEAHKGLRLSNAEHLHQRLSAAALVIGRFADWRFCPQCRHLDYLAAAEHGCGPLSPVDVIVVRRPNPPTTEEQP